jgi:probable rRNA maturation factor
LTRVEVTGAAVPRFSRREIASFARQVLRAAGPRDLSEISIVFVDDQTMRRLNRRFRHRHQTTDVLTFSDGAAAEIVISLHQARRQAAAENHSLATELRYLILHGTLHALGHDHETDRGEMDALELRVRDAVGLDGE